MKFWQFIEEKTKHIWQDKLNVCVVLYLVAIFECAVTGHPSVVTWHDNTSCLHNSHFSISIDSPVNVCTHELMKSPQSNVHLLFTVHTYQLPEDS